MRLNHTSQLTKVVLTVEFILLAYLLFALTNNVYRSYKLDLHIQTFEAENAAIIAENANKSTDFLYYNSQQYVDKMIKQNFGLVNPGEEIIILPPETANLAAEGVTGEPLPDVDPELAGLSNPQLWWKFFFDR